MAARKDGVNSMEAVTTQQLIIEIRRLGGLTGNTERTMIMAEKQCAINRARIAAAGGEAGHKQPGQQAGAEAIPGQGQDEQGQQETPLCPPAGGGVDSILLTNSCTCI